MLKFIAGIIVGLCIGVIGSAGAASLVGGSGYIMGWGVQIKGKIVCSDPFISIGTKTIDCDWGKL